jgi:hypothetical protein
MMLKLRLCPKSRMILTLFGQSLDFVKFYKGRKVFGFMARSLDGL